MIEVARLSDADRNAWERLYLAYADFYRVPVSAGTLDVIWSWIFDDSLYFYCLVAKSRDGDLIGLAHYKAILSPLRGQAIGFLDDIYVDPGHRGEGAVDALFAALKMECQTRGWTCMRWHTRDNNYRARKVYDKYASRTDWLTYQLDAAEPT